MRNTDKYNTSAILSSAALILALAPLSLTRAAPGTLSTSPLFLSNNVDPNIMFVLDDSGSMDWGTMTPEADGVMNLVFAYFYTHPAPENDYTWIVPTEEQLLALGEPAPAGGVWRAWFSGYNSLYYDPTVTYVPWPGEDPSGNTYMNSVPTAAMVNPANSAAGTIDLTATTAYNTDYGPNPALGLFTVNNFYPARYYTWTDSDTDGVVDPGDAHNLVEIRNTGTYIGGINRSDCPAAPICAYSEEIQNFANWFSYYRKREYVAKAAYGQVIAATNEANMGLKTLWDNNGVNTPLRQMNSDITSGNKGALLDSVYNFNASGWTPLRATTNDVGRYIACESNNISGTCPAAPAGSGGECQQNFSVIMTDGFYNGNFDLTGDAAPSANNDNEDGDSDTAWDSTDNGPYGDIYGNTLADITMHYYETDLRSTVNNDVPTIAGVDENDAQHMVTYTIAFGVDGTLSDADMPTNRTDPFTWPDPSLGDPQKIDDMRHAAWNSRGEFLSAKSSENLITSLRGALASISGRTGSAASVAFNTGSLSTNSEVYLALFNSERWSGDMLAFPLDPNTGVINPARVWSAATQLDGRNLSSNPRTILSHNGTDGIALQWSNLTTAQKNDFRTNSSGTQDNIATGMARLAHLRGDRNCEPSTAGTCSYSDGSNTFNTKSLRERDSRLGDILHSGPVFAGAPESNWPDLAPFPSTAGSTYTDFQTANANRTGIVYAGGNDGMLHAFLQSSGDELFAYVPGPLFSTNASEGLHYLSDPGYAHRYYVDQTVSIADAYVQTTSGGTLGWKTILVGALRGGGRGLFALDITAPTTVTESGSVPANTVMWEFTNANDTDLGYTYSRPFIVPLEGTSGTIRWAAVFGNGYNDTGSGEAQLFIVFLEGGIDGTWTANSDYIKISTGVGTTTDRNGLSTPAIIDSDGDGFADRVYAGDLKGNMWVFDLSGSSSNTWGVAYKSGATPNPLFTTASNQQITTMPVIIRNSAQPISVSNTPNTLVIFGSGQYLTTGDISTTDTQSMYGVWDSGSKNLTSSNLIQQTIGVGVSTETVVGRTLTDVPIDYAGTDKGWYMNFPTNGERSITNPVIRGDLVFFNTTIPDRDPCNFGGGGWLMVAKWINGGQPDDVAFDLNGDGTLSNLDQVGGNAAAGQQIDGLPTSPVNLGNKRYVATTETTDGSSIETTEIQKVTGPDTGRLSWEELLL